MEIGMWTEQILLQLLQMVLAVERILTYLSIFTFGSHNNKTMTHQLDLWYWGMFPSHSWMQDK